MAALSLAVVQEPAVDRRRQGPETRSLGQALREEEGRAGKAGPALE
jgi:hypothetical protein